MMGIIPGMKISLASGSELLLQQVTNLQRHALYMSKYGH